MTATFTPDEEAEIELMLWEYDRDGRIAIDNFFRREPDLSLRMTDGIVPKRIKRDFSPSTNRACSAASFRHFAASGVAVQAASRMVLQMIQTAPAASKVRNR